MEPVNISSGGLSFQNPEIPSPIKAESEGKSFESVLVEYVGKTNEGILEADNAIKDLVDGKIDNPHDVMIQMQEAQLSLQYTVQLRNKVVEAYQELMRMQI